MKVILVEVAAFIKVFEDNADLRNGVAGRVNLSSIQSMGQISYSRASHRGHSDDPRQDDLPMHYG